MYYVLMIGDTLEYDEMRDEDESMMMILKRLKIVVARCTSTCTSVRKPSV